jgi:Ni/Co efflux regulator RcnB
MKKLVLAAVAAMAVAAPTIASATEFGVRIGGDRDYYRDRDYGGPRAEFYGHDRGFHHGWFHRDYDGDRTVVIQRHHWDDY